MIAIPQHANEPPAQYAAFCAFARYGPGRSLPIVAKELKMSPPRLRQWCRRFGWRRRCEEYDLASAAEEARLQEEALKSKTVDWIARRDEILEKEYQLAMELFALVKERLDDPRVPWEARDIINLLELGSLLGHRATAHLPPPPTLQDLERSEQAMERLRYQLHKVYGKDRPAPTRTSGLVKTQPKNTVADTPIQ